MQKKLNKNEKQCVKKIQINMFIKHTQNISKEADNNRKIE